jgi:isoleucyl-tRNA synthetase
VALAGVTLAADEVEILATPRPGTAVAHDEGLVVVIDTELTPELRAEGDARELARAIQDLRREAGLELDDRIEVRVEAGVDSIERVRPFAARVAADTLADRFDFVAVAASGSPATGSAEVGSAASGSPAADAGTPPVAPDGWAGATVALDAGPALVRLRARKRAH